MKMKLKFKSILSIVLCFAISLTAMITPITANAVSGSFTGGEVCNGYRLKIKYSESELNHKKNTSKVTATLYLVQDSTYDLYISTRSATITINGTKTTISNIPAIQNTGGVTTKLGSASKTITHNSDGTKKISIAGTFDMNATLSGTYYGTMSTKKVLSLDELDRTKPKVTLKFDSATETSVKLTATANATCDKWEYSKDGGSNWVSFGSEGKENTFTIKNLSGGTAYSIVARARKIKNNLTSAKSSAVTATTKPKSPVSLKVDPITQTSAKVSWAKPTGANSYKVYLNDTQKATGITNLYYNFTGLTANTKYTFGVIATGTSGDSTKSSVSATTLPNVPTGLKVTNKTDKSVTLSWSYNNGGGAITPQYVIYRNGTKINTSTTTSYTDNTYGNNNVSYSVSAQASGESAKSSAVSVTYVPLSITLNATNKSTYATITPSFSGGLNRAVDTSSYKWAYGNQNTDYFENNGYAFTDSFAVLQNGTYTVFAKDTSGNKAVGTIVVSGIYTKPTKDAFIQTFTDLSVDSIGLPISFERTYNSIDNSSNIFGNGWSLNYAKSTKLSDNGDVRIVSLPDGTINYFSVTESGFVGIKTQNKLVANENMLTLTTKDRTKYIYEDNYLTRIEDANGNTIEITLNEQKLPSSITDSVGRIYTVAYTNNKITSITDPAGRVFTYVYDDNGHLVQQKQGNGTIVNSFEYTNGLLTCIKDNLGNAIYTVEYINQNQVAKITDAEGSATHYLYKITSNGDLVVYESDSEIVLDEMDSESHPANNTYNPFEQIIVDSDKLMYTYNEDGTVSEINGESSDKTLVTYSYDENGNVVIITTTDEKQRLIEESTYTYSYFEGTTNIQSVTEIIVTNTYDDEKNTTETDSQTITSTYDSAGNLLSERIVHNDDDNTVTYTYGDNGLLLSEIADGITTEYTYDANGYVTNIKTIENGIEKNTSYSYNIIGLVLTKTENGLTHNNYYDNYGILTQTQFDIYTINYIDNSIDSICVNDTALISYGYSTNKLDSETYANGQNLLYNYDDNGNVIEVFASSKTDENKLFSYIYSQVPEDSEEEQKLLSVIDYKNNLRTDYTYTPYGEADEDGNQDESVTSTVYDISGETDNLLYTYSSRPDGESLTFSDSNITNQFSEETLYSNVTDEQTGEVTQEESGTKVTTSLQTNQHSEYSNINTNDADGALTNKEIKHGSSTIYYTNYTYDEDNRISFEESNGSGLSYTYDDNENITVISNGINTVEYVYDENSQLIRANDQFNNKTYVYEYDSRGNILSKKEYVYTTETDLSQLTPTKNDSYTYYANDGINWCDELSTFNGDNLIYDEVGNLTSYNGYTYTWVNGRQLAEISNGTNTYSYTYNDNGIRTSKMVNGVTTNYFTNDGTILAEYNDSYSINYWYDEIGNPVGFIYKDKTLENPEERVYIYTKNMQGDITGILDNTGTLVTQYIYDAWGCITNISGTLSATIGTINGLRYRGYYYDNETGYYYLQSRYYNPEFSRFINSDDVIQNELNLFAYCYNNIVNVIDPTGNKPKSEKLSFVIFYDAKEFKAETDALKKELNRLYKVSTGKTISIKSTDGFIEKWNALKSTDLVILNFHGDEKSIGELSTSDVGKLERKTIDSLIVLGCNCAHQAITWSNICEKLSKKVTGNVVGDDGTTYSGYDEKIKSGFLVFDSKADEEWKNIEEKYNGKRNKNKGWMVYHYNSKSKKIHCYTTKIKILYFPHILDYLHNNRNGKLYTKKYFIFYFKYY